MTRLLGLYMALLFGLSGCVSISTLQDAETTPDGEMSHTLAVGNIGGEVDTDGASGLPGDLAENISIPMIEYMFRYGFKDDMDFGLKFSGSSYGLDWKWNLLNDEFGLAVGLALALSEYEVEFVGLGKEKYSLQDITVPIYLHYNVGVDTRVYLVPKLVQRSVNAPGEDTSNSLFGATVGFKWKKIFLEYTMLSGESEESKEDISVNQFALGYRF